MYGLFHLRTTSHHLCRVPAGRLAFQFPRKCRHVGDQILERHRELKSSKRYPWKGHILLSEPLNTWVENGERHISRWDVQFKFEDRSWRLLGCTEDIRCLASSDTHSDDFEIPPFCTKLCSRCEVPVFHDCSGHSENITRSLLFLMVEQQSL